MLKSLDITSTVWVVSVIPAPGPARPVSKIELLNCGHSSLLTGHSRNEFERPQHSERPQRREIWPRLSVLLLREQVGQETAIMRKRPQRLCEERGRHGKFVLANIVFNSIKVCVVDGGYSGRRCGTSPVFLGQTKHGLTRKVRTLSEFHNSSTKEMPKCIRHDLAKKSCMGSGEWR